MDTTILKQRRAVRQPGALRKDVAKFWERVLRFEQQNVECAEIFLRDIARHGGEGAGLVIWARMALTRAAERRAA
jgi:hypothetical protein